MTDKAALDDLLLPSGVEIGSALDGNNGVGPEGPDKEEDSTESVRGGAMADAADDQRLPFCEPEALLPEITPVLQKIQAKRSRSLFVIVANPVDEWLPERVYQWRKQLRKIGASGPFDVLLHSPGGSLTDCYRTARLLASYADDWDALVPRMAASGATLVCLGSNNIVMPDIAFLGPVDPQVLSKRSTKFFTHERQSPLEAFQAVRYLREFSLTTIEAVTAYLISRQRVAPLTALETASKLSVELARPVLEKIEPYDLGSFALDSRLASRYCEGISAPVEERKLTQRGAQINALVEQYPAHEFSIDRSEAEALGFKVSEPDEALEDAFEELGRFLDRLKIFVGFVPER